MVPLDEKRRHGAEDVDVLCSSASDQVNHPQCQRQKPACDRMQVSPTVPPPMTPSDAGRQVDGSDKSSREWPTGFEERRRRPSTTLTLQTMQALQTATKISRGKMSLSTPHVRDRILLVACGPRGFSLSCLCPVSRLSAFPVLSLAGRREELLLGRVEAAVAVRWRREAAVSTAYVCTCRSAMQRRAVCSAVCSAVFSAVCSGRVLLRSKLWRLSCVGTVSP